MWSLEDNGTPSGKGEKSDREKLYMNEKLHGILDASCSQRLQSLAMELGVITEADINPLSHFQIRKLNVMFAKFLGNRIEYCSVVRETDPIVTLIEMIFPCGMHNGIRIQPHLH